MSHDYKRSNCVYCGTKLYTNSPYEWRRLGTKDHIRPKSDGGSGMEGYNIVYACPWCNRKKDNYYITYFHQHYYQDKNKEFYDLNDVLYCIRMCMRDNSNYRDYYLKLAGYYPDDVISQEILKYDR